MSFCFFKYEIWGILVIFILIGIVCMFLLIIEVWSKFFLEYIFIKLLFLFVINNVLIFFKKMVYIVL